jgi:hypothetical protein
LTELSTVFVDNSVAIFLMQIKRGPKTTSFDPMQNISTV